VAGLGAMEKDLNENNNRITEQNHVLKTCIAVLFFLFAISVCVLGIVLSASRNDRSIGGFIDLSPDQVRNTRFVIIGGRVFYPNKEPKNYTFPREPLEETTVEITDDESDEVITLQHVDPIAESEIDTDVTKIDRPYYSVSRYTLGDNRNKDFKDETKWIELLTLADDDKKVWTQKADIDLFRNDDGKILNLAPGAEGYFRFQINNKSGGTVHAVMSINEPEAGIHLPMVFSLKDETGGEKSPDTILEKDGAVKLSFDIAKDGSGTYRLNWKWPYESGDDSYDGLVGNQAGKYILNAEIYAETEN